MKKLKVGIIGTGNIGTDLLLKLINNPLFEVKIFVGRREDSEGIRIAKENNIETSTKGIEHFTNYYTPYGKQIDLVFDCTNAKDALENNKILSQIGIKVIDLTPAKIGPMCIPNVNCDSILTNNNVNMITCGGQASIPILHLISQNTREIRYIEIVSQIASKSAGMATRINIDNYIHTTEKAIEQFTGCKNKKVILNLNPAEPCVDMQTTMFIDCEVDSLEGLTKKIENKVEELQQYIPYYKLIMKPHFRDDGILMLSIKVKGRGDYLESFAGNLDIINVASIEVAKRLIK